MIISEIKSHNRPVVDYSEGETNGLAQALFEAATAGFLKIDEVMARETDGRSSNPFITVMYSKDSSHSGGFARVGLGLHQKEVLSFGWSSGPNGVSLEARLENPSYKTIKRLGQKIKKMRVQVDGEYVNGHELMLA